MLSLLQKRDFKANIINGDKEGHCGAHTQINFIHKFRRYDTFSKFVHNEQYFSEQERENHKQVLIDLHVSVIVADGTGSQKEF